MGGQREHWIVTSALEWFYASGERTRTRLDRLVDHFIGIYGGVGGLHRETLKATAWRKHEEREGNR